MSKKWVDGVLSDMTAEEQTQYDNDIAALASKSSTAATTETTKATNQKAGYDKLIELGLTGDQVTALTGYTPPTE